MINDHIATKSITEIMNSNFRTLFGDLTLNELIADWQPILLTRESDPWLNFPPQDFIDFVRGYPTTPFDGIPMLESYIKQPTFLIAQIHRIWQTTYFLNQYLIKTKAKNFLDLGSYPFYLPLVVRDYFGFNGEIITTTNLTLSQEQTSFLTTKKIQVFPLDLDPYVNDPTDGNPKLPTSLELDTNSIDLILSSHVIEHLYHPKTMMQECARLLRPGGKIIITTDNAMMIDVWLNYIAGYGYTFEPVEHTAALSFHFWRGHVRFFTQKDLETIARSVGLTMSDVNFSHCIYDILFEDYFKNPIPQMAGWQKKMMRDVPWLRNDISIVAEKGG